MTKKEVATQIAERLNEEMPDLASTPQAVEQVINALTGTIKDAVFRGETVTLRGFGSFSPKPYREKKCRNIGTGETVWAPAGVKPAFKPAPDFVEQVRSSPVHQTVS